MSEELIRSLREEVARLSGELKTTRDEAAKRRTQAKEFKAQLEAVMAERDEFAEAFQGLHGEHEELQARINSDPNDLNAEIAKLKGQIRERDHKDAFGKLAKELGIHEAAIDDAYTLSGYKPEADSPDADALRSLIESQVAARPWLKAPAPVADSQPHANGLTPPAGGPGGQSRFTPTNPASTPGPGAGRAISTLANEGTPAPSGGLPPAMAALVSAFGEGKM